MSESSPRESAVGHLAALSAYVLWGLLPFYWKQLGSVPAGEILLHRILWSCVFSWFVLVVVAGRKAFAGFRSWVVWRQAAVAALLLAVNWLIYLSAVEAGRIVDASLGYFMTPIVNVALGIAFLGERLRPAQMVALLLAAGGVVYLTVAYGSFPWIAVGIALSFGFYALIKKTGTLDSVRSFAAESLLIAPLALGAMVYLALSSTGHLGIAFARESLFLVGSGAITAIPLWLFASGARRVPMKTIGFLQYVSPTLLLLVGTLGYGEPFDRKRLLGFALIWAALILYTISLLARRKRGIGYR